ncbi:MAG TPA: O-antigen ligase family protein [Phycisphaerae bacterium]|nr:O-antigen ligase family protein [Phycisphaerae bacterium]HNU44558.1 O-antigen ligase family protein [Phycisphaerae bacterium]
MRVYLLWLVVVTLGVWAWRNWFVPACALVFLSVFMQRQDFPQYLLGINGLNPWNLLFVVTVLGWWLDRRAAQRPWDVPRLVTVTLAIFVFLIGVAYVRAVLDLEAIAGGADDEPGQGGPGFLGFTGEFLINRVKFIVLALMLFDGCRTRRRLLAVAGVAILAAFVYAICVMRHVPLSSLATGSTSEFMAYRHRIDRDVGLMAIDMSMLLAGAFWATLTFACLCVRRWQVRALLLGAAGAMFLGMILCHSRGSYLGFAAAGVVLGLARWRKLLLALPLTVIVVCAAVPAVPARLGMGWSAGAPASQDAHDWDQVTAGRVTDLWPAAFEQFTLAPALGFGGVACQRTAVRDRWLEGGSAPTHPHNAYLEVLLDMGVVGLLPVLVLHVGIFVLTLRLFRDRTDRVLAGVGGMGLATITVLLVTALGCQSFYPTQSTLPYWCLWALALRVVVEKSKVAWRPAANAASAPSRRFYDLGAPGLNRLGARPPA